MFGNLLPRLNDQQPVDPTTLTPDSLKRRRDIAMALAAQGSKTGPVGHWAEGLNRVAQALVGSYELGSAEKQEAAARRSGATDGEAAIAAILAGQSPGAAAPAASPAVGAPASGDAPNIPPGLINSESGGNFRAQNAAVGAGGQAGHFGRVQFGHARLQEAAAAGAIPQGTTPQAFMASPQLQQAAERWHFADIDAKIRENGLDRMVGQSLGGVPITLDGMRAVAHLGGSEGLRKFIQSGGRYNPADANGTRLSDYLRRHASQRTASVDDMWNTRQRVDYSRPQQSADVGAAVSSELGLTQPTALTSLEGGLPAPAMSPSDAFGENFQPPLIDGRNLPQDAPQAAMPPPLGDQAAAGDLMGMQPSPVAAALAGFPIPEPRPAAADAMRAPMPQARPDMAPNALPPQAQPAGPMPQQGMNERDRLMLLRDEQSLAPAEADALRLGLGGDQPQAPTQMRQPSPVAQALAQPSAPPPAQPGATPAGQPAGDPRSQIVRLLAVVNNPWVPEGTRSMAASVLQRHLDPGAQERQRLQTDSLRLGNQQTQRQLSAPLPNSPEAHAAQRAQREVDADKAGLTGATRQRFVLTGQLPDQSATENVSAMTRARETEAQRLGLRAGTPEYQNYVLTGRFRDSPELSAADRKAIMEAEDQVPIVQNTLTSLRRALALNDQAFSGFGAGARATIGTSGVPGAGLLVDEGRAKASREFNQIMSKEAIDSMSQTLKGATTDREMAQFVEILGNPSTPPDIRARTIEKMVTLAERQLQLQQTRIQQLRGRDYFRPGGGQPGTAPPAATPAQAPPPAANSAPSAAPQVGEVRRGYRFKGGDPSKQENWERAQ